MKCKHCGGDMNRVCESPAGNTWGCRTCGNYFVQVRSLPSWRRRLTELTPHVRRVFLQAGYFKQVSLYGN